MVRTDNSDPAALARFRADELVSGLPRCLRRQGHHGRARAHRHLIPDEWLEAAGVGSAEHCAATVHEQRSLGADA
jgi:5,10-methylenetetrahydromethanopterin reductase